MKPGSLLVIGFGNTLRSDDGVGQRVANAIEAEGWPNVSTLSVTLLTPELAEPVSRAERVIFVDAETGGEAVVRLRPVMPAQSSQLIAHAASAETVLALARDVFGGVPRAWMLTIPARSLEIGEDLSGSTQRGLQEAIARIRTIAESGTRD